MSYNSQTSWRAPSVSSVEEAEEQPRKALLAEGTAHISKSTADHGFEYQRELMLYFCLKFNKMENCEWICAIEVVEFDKIDDIVMEFTLNGENHSYLMQAKHVLSDQKVVTLEHLLETNRQEIKNNNLKKNFALINYSEAVKKVNWPEDRIVKFFLLTNYQVDYMTTEFEGKESKSNKKKDENDKNESKKVISYKVKAPEIVDGETEEIAKLFTDIKVKDSTKFTKFPQSIELIDKTKIDDEIFLDNFTLISGLENLTNLITINNQMLEESFMSKNCITMRNAIFKAMETRKVKVVSDDPTSKEQFKEIRDPITREKFNRIILNSVIEVDLPIYTNDFLSQLPKWLDISGKSFKKLSNGVKKIYTKGNAKLVAFMLYREIMQQQSESNAHPPYCIPYSKLNAIYKKALMTSERKVVVYVDSKDANEDFRKYKNAIFVIQTNVESTPNMICTFEDLTKDAQEGLKRTFVKFQGFDVKIKDLTDDKVFLTEILQEVCNANKMLEFGTKLPLDQLPKYYINRQFTLNDTVVYNKDPINEEDVFEQGQNTIIQGLGGIGKSTAMIKLAEEVKKSNPNFFVYFGDLKTYSKIFSYAQSGNINIIGPNDAQMPNSKNIDAWQFVLDYFIGFYEKEKKSEQSPAGMHLGETEREQKLQKSLLEVYLKEENPKIILFLDGFDEISPLYTAQVIQIINGLKQRKVQMFVSSQSHLKKIMKELKFEGNYTLEPYTKHMQSDFLRLYWTNYLEEKQLNDALMEKVDRNNINVYTKKFFKMCYRSMLTNITPSIPLMLNILADIYKDECIEFCMKTHRGKSKGKKWKKKTH
uniref:NACHT domain-containing protein n=1 Tax=Lutzomyia longipalpis TaxID=7200 RepID=A0A7G3B4Y4_LUTLO